MHEPKPDPNVDNDDDEGGGLSLAFVTDILAGLAQYWRLLAVILPIGLALSAASFLSQPRTYEADALIGPRGPSPTDSMLASVTSGGTSGVARRLLGGGVPAGSDPYQEYLQLLPSTRLAQVLIDRYHLDRQIFADQWDDEKHEWRTSALQPYKDSIKRLLRMPVTHGPDVDAMMGFFDGSLSVSGVSTGMASSLIPGTATYTQVKLKYRDPQQAVSILNTILLATDQIIREDQRRDVDARVSTLESEISQVANSDERSSLIDVLTSQKQLQTMIQTDHRYASTLVVPPYASTRAISPTVSGSVEFASVVSVLVWIGLVLLSRRLEFLGHITRWFVPKS